MKKIIFLDHDGVICLSEAWGGRFKKKGFDSNPETPIDIRMDDFDVKAVKVLNNIIEITGCEIVVSSDWKLHGTLEQMKEMYITRRKNVHLEVKKRWKIMRILNSLKINQNLLLHKSVETS
jgi:hypothetical protein